MDWDPVNVTVLAGLPWTCPAGRKLVGHMLGISGGLGDGGGMYAGARSSGSGPTNRWPVAMSAGDVAGVSNTALAPGATANLVGILYYV